jgi:threonine/homoserine/homoserine lactone efflux protein
LALGIGRIVSGQRTPPSSRARRPYGSLWRDGFLTSATNPKAVLFFAALFPQFIDPELSLLLQVVILGATYLALDGAMLAVYGAASSRIAGGIGASAGRRVDRIAGGLMIGAALLLGSKSLAR